MRRDAACVSPIFRHPSPLILLTGPKVEMTNRVVIAVSCCQETGCLQAQTGEVNKEDVEFVSHQNTILLGTLWKSAAASRPVPGILCVHGSGKIDRNGVYKAEVPDHFSHRGVVRCFDKRGVGKSGGDYAGRYRVR